MKKWLKTDRIIVAAIATTLASAAMAQAAPNCGLTGNWTMTGHLSQLRTKPTQTQPNPPIDSFALDCQITIANDGTYSGECLSYILNKPPVRAAASGQIIADSECRLSGQQNASQGVSIIFGGAVRGNVASLTAYRGNANKPSQVRSLILIREP